MDFCAKFYPLSVIVCTRIKKVHKGYVCCYLNKPLHCSSELYSVFSPMIIFPEATIKVYTCCFRGVSNDTPTPPCVRACCENICLCVFVCGPYSTADVWLKKKFQVAGRTTFCHLFFINPYVIGTRKLPVASPKNMYNLSYSHLKMTTPFRSKGRFRATEII